MRQTSQNRGLCAFQDRMYARQEEGTDWSKCQVASCTACQSSSIVQARVGWEERAACRSKGNGNGTVDPDPEHFWKGKAQGTIHARYGALLGNPHIDTM